MGHSEAVIVSDPRNRSATTRGASRAGVASLDYVLILGVVLPMVVFILRIGPRIIRLAYEMVSLLVSWPFL
jgi:hypothetical protein